MLTDSEFKDKCIVQVECLSLLFSWRANMEDSEELLKPNGPTAIRGFLFTAF